MGRAGSAEKRSLAKHGAVFGAADAVGNLFGALGLAIQQSAQIEREGELWLGAKLNLSVTVGRVP
jgi:hypothetical protein